MQAAAAHLAAQPQAQPAAARRLGTPEQASRSGIGSASRWAFPTLATVGAVAVFMVANRVFLNPERTLAPRPAAEAPSVPALSDPAMAEPRWTGEPPELDRSGPATARITQAVRATTNRAPINASLPTATCRAQVRR